MADSISIIPQEAVVKYYKPSELLEMFSSYLSQQKVNVRVIYLRGIYLKNPKHDPRWLSRFDILRDENTQQEITLQIPYKLCDDLKDGNLVTVGGVLDRRVQNNGYIQLMLAVSRVEVVQEQAIDEKEIKRMELRRQKSKIGFKNVDSILEQLLFTDQRPKVALVFATTSITMADFNAGIQAAKTSVDFNEYRANFSNSNELCLLLKNIDTKGYDVIAIIRGGGGGIEKLDEIDVLETICSMKTAIIAAIGHVQEKLFFKQLADKEAPTPNGLGQYFSDMVETVSEKKNKSRAALTEQIKKQFKEQLESGKKQNKELQEKLAKLTKTQEETQKLHKEQVEKSNKQNEELQKKLATITKANETSQKAHTEQLSKLQVQLKAVTEQGAKQSKEFNESLKKMQETNSELNKSLQKLTAQNTQTSKDLQEAKDKARNLEKQLEDALNKNKGCSSGCLGVLAAILTVASAACWIIGLII